MDAVPWRALRSARRLGDFLPVIVSQIHTLSFRNFDRDHFDRGSPRVIS